ncbi:MAG: SEC-C metal-binding domain-containing protein [Legionella sp.]
MMRRLGMKPGEPIEHSLVTKAIENAQRKLEGHHFDVRKQLLDYDNVANDQRQVIYTQRASIMEMTDTSELVEVMREEVISNLVDTYIPPISLEDQWDPKALSDVLADEFQVKAPVAEWIDADHSIQPEQIKNKVLELAIEHYDEKINSTGRPVMAQFEKSVILQTLDNQWREHLASMDQLRQGIHLRGYAQKDPKQEYKKEAFSLFTSMLDTLKYDVIKLLSSVEIQTEEDAQAVEELRRAEQIRTMSLNHEDPNEQVQEENAAVDATFRRQEKKVGRNEACPCGSGKKYKSCHGSLA